MLHWQLLLNLSLKTKWGEKISAALLDGHRALPREELEGKAKPVWLESKHERKVIWLKVPGWGTGAL